MRAITLTTTAFLALLAAPVAADDFDLGLLLEGFGLRIATRDDDGPRYERHAAHFLRRDRVRPRLQRHHRRHWVEGHYEYDTVRTWVEGYYQTVQIPARYRTERIRGRHGRIHVRTILIEPARVERVWRPGHWVTETVKRWVPGYWEVLS